MISKELLSEVLGEEVSAMHIRGNKLNYVVPNYETEEDGEIVYIDLGTNINIYELAHKCKENARAKGYLLYSYPIDVLYSRYACDVKDKRGVQLMMQSGESEPEAIFKACEWILKEKSC